MEMVKSVGEYIIVKQVEKEQKVSTGILLPDDMEVETKGEGVITSISEKNSLNLVEGDYIYFAQNAGQDITLEGKKFRVLRPQDILAMTINA